MQPRVRVNLLAVYSAKCGVCSLAQCVCWSSHSSLLLKSHSVLSRGHNLLPRQPGISGRQNNSNGRVGLPSLGPVKIGSCTEITTAL